jgi:SAM-dependent methyltransferase
MIEPQIIRDIQEIEKQSCAIHGADPACVARDYVSERIYREQLEGLLDYAAVHSGAGRLLEIGSGFGMFLALANSRYPLRAYGIEPEDQRRTISLRMLRCYQVCGSFVSGAVGESMPFKSETFDYIFSANVLEHCCNPAAVVLESLRVLKKGGFLQFIVPNYHSFFEGHYGIFWIPGISKGLARLYVRLWNRDPSYIDSLQFTTWRSLWRTLRDRRDIEWTDWGERSFMARLNMIAYPIWKDNGRLFRVLSLLRTMGLLDLVSWLACRMKMYTPIILTLKKKGPNSK